MILLEWLITDHCYPVKRPLFTWVLWLLRYYGMVFPMAYF